MNIFELYFTLASSSWETTWAPFLGNIIGAVLGAAISATIAIIVMHRTNLESWIIEKK